MTWDIPALIQSAFVFGKTALDKFVKSVPEKVALDLYNAKKKFKEFRKKVIDDTPDRTSDLNDDSL